MFNRPVITDHRLGRSLQAHELSVGEINEALSGALTWTGCASERENVVARLEIELIARARGLSTGNEKSN